MSDQTTPPVDITGLNADEWHAVEDYMAPAPASWALLSRIDVSDKIEKKNGLSYLSWAWAWGELKNHYPSATFLKHQGIGGMPYFFDASGYAFVKVTVTVQGVEVTEMLPVLNHANKPVQNPDSFAVNNALQRCLTKAIAYHGLGHYIYAGEDLPQQADEPDVPEAAPTPRKKPATAPLTSGVTQGGVVVPMLPVADPAASTGVAVVSIDDTITTATSIEMVQSVFVSFIPLMETEADLTKLYSTNKVAVTYLESRAPDIHKQVIAAFAARRAELKTKGAK